MALIFHWIIAPRMASPSKEGLEKKDAGVYLAKPSNGPLYKQGWQRSIATPSDLYTICMVTCYSEDETAIKGTLDSIAGTDYPDERKLLFVICDGLIHGAGNAKFTPDIVISLMTQDPRISGVPEPVSYLANADGVKQHNMAKVVCLCCLFLRVLSMLDIIFIAKNRFLLSLLLNAALKRKDGLLPLKS